MMITNPKGESCMVWSGRSEEIGHGGSSDGSIVNSPEKWLELPQSLSPAGKPYFGGCVFSIFFTPDAAVTLDISDARIIIPFTLENGVVSTIGNNAVDMDKYLIGDVALVAGQESLICEHRIPQGNRQAFGGGKIFVSLENNA